MVDVVRVSSVPLSRLWYLMFELLGTEWYTLLFILLKRYVRVELYKDTNMGKGLYYDVKRYVRVELYKDTDMRKGMYYDVKVLLMVSVISLFRENNMTLKQIYFEFFMSYALYVFNTACSNIPGPQIEVGCGNKRISREERVCIRL